MRKRGKNPEPERKRFASQKWEKFLPDPIRCRVRSICFIVTDGQWRNVQRLSWQLIGP